MQGDCLLNILRTSFIKPAAKLSLLLLPPSLSPAHTFPPGDELERGTATAHSDTIRTTDLIPTCPSTHTFNLLDAQRSLRWGVCLTRSFWQRALWFHLKWVCGCVQIQSMSRCVFPHVNSLDTPPYIGLFTPSERSVKKKTTQAKRDRPGKF